MRTKYASERTVITMSKVKVVFRVFRDGNDVLALFPAEPWNGNGDCSSYDELKGEFYVDVKPARNFGLKGKE